MGLFNYSKPGPGVKKGLYEPPLKIFFSVFFRKFFKLLRLNFMYFISTLLLWFLLFVPTLADVTEENIISNYNSQILIYMLITVVGLPIFNTGFSYVLRNFSRQHHSWIWSDFWDTVKSNIKQSTALTLIDIVVFIVGTTAISFYSSTDIINPYFSLALKTILIISFIVYFIMHYFIYTIMVTFDLSLKNIFRNAFMLTFIKLPRNVGITLLIYIIGALVFSINGVIGILLCVLIMSIFVNYIVTFNAVSLVDKYLMPIEEDDDDENEVCFDDNLTVTNDKN